MVPVLLMALLVGCRDGDADDFRPRKDCDDANAASHPGALEVCDGEDNDCNGFIDDLVTDATEWHRDRDADAHGNPNTSYIACQAPPGWVIDATDCDDMETASFPNNPEICDDVDNDCNELVDDGVLETFYADVDADGFGGTAEGMWEGCVAPPGWSKDGTDCDDEDDERYPGNVEVCDGVDNDCDALADDGVTSTFHPDLDSDGFGSTAGSWDGCEAPPAWIADGTDCDDADEQSFPGNPEVCDGADNNCDGTADEGKTSVFYADADSDGFGNKTQSYKGCTAPLGWLTDSTDCNDASQAAYPGNKEVCDRLDNDCDGLADNGVIATFYADADGDSYGNPAVPITACAPPPGFVADKTDCNDGDFFTWPGAYDECNGVDNDCDGKVDNNGYDSDADGIDNCNDPTVYNEQFNTCVGPSSTWGPRGWGVTQYADLICCGAGVPGMPQSGVPVDQEKWNWGCGTSAGILDSGNVNAGHSIAYGPDMGKLNVFTVSARIGAGGVNVDDVGIVLNYTGPGDFFMVRWDDPNNAYVRSTRIDFIRCVAGQCAILDTVNPAATAGVGYTSFDVQVRYDAIDIYVAGVLQLSTITNGGDIGPGRVGVYAFDADSGSHVDSLVVTQP